ncbi:HNH endonuclease [Arthrobacter sp. zg-Y1219]|uniref:HNH endonuclease n=1 Tax=Arthrobacter sp. zg-Y1219 TaxID=3049067 RepID=UPI0024C24BB0|nr:HNH endonuclease signature motif containing protein [Arthrobacter sp. zg-Y1219]MDK1358653.1 HNH endonuclease [Arthrobacter sp. zg-Y1219]
MTTPIAPMDPAQHPLPFDLQVIGAGLVFAESLQDLAAALTPAEAALDSASGRASTPQAGEQIAGNPAELEQLGDRKLIARIKSLSYGLDPHAVVNRAAHAVSERYVSCRPAPDTMTYLTALLPVAQGVGVFAALTRDADRLRASGDPRTKGQIMADTLVERTTGQARAEDVRVEVQLIMTDRTLLHGILPPDTNTNTNTDTNTDTDTDTDMNTVADTAAELDAARTSADTKDPGTASFGGIAAGRQMESFVPDGAEPAVLAGYGIVPAQWARDLIRGPDPVPDDPIPDRPDPGDRDRARDSAPKSAPNPARGPAPNPARGPAPNPARGPARGPARDPGSATAGWGTVARRPDPRTEVWLRRLYIAPDSGQLTAMDSRARLVPGGLARLIAARDQICRTPWCGAPIRHYDHITPVREGGPTSAENIQGLCQACNQAKEAPGWSAQAAESPPTGPRADGSGVGNAAGSPGRHRVMTTTPTGHVYQSMAPPPPAVRGPYAQH